MDVKEKENYNSSDPSTFSQKIHSTVPNARNKIFQSKTMFPTNSVYWHVNAVEHNKRTSPATSTTTLEQLRSQVPRRGTGVASLLLTRRSLDDIRIT